MPIYEYQCTEPECKMRFERYVKLEDEPPQCPRCGDDTQQVLSVPAKRNPDHGIQR